MSRRLQSELFGLGGSIIDNIFADRRFKQAREETLEDRGIVSDMFTAGITRENNLARNFFGGLDDRNTEFAAGRGGRFSEEFDPIRSGLSINVAQGERAGRDIIGGFQQRRATGLRNLEGLGRFERSEINRRSVNRGNFAQANLLRSGLSGSTIGTSARFGNERLRGQELGGLDARLRQERLGFDAQLSGDTLRAMEGQKGFQANLRGSTLGALGDISGSQLADERTTFDTGFGNRFALENRELDRSRSALELRARPFENTVRQIV